MDAGWQIHEIETEENKILGDAIDFVQPYNAGWMIGIGMDDVVLRSVL